LSVIVKVFDCGPASVGVKVTVIVQDDCAARLVPHVFVSAKLPALAILVMERGALPVFFKVRLDALLVVVSGCKPKVRLGGETQTSGAVPVMACPERGTTCGLPGALSEIVNDP
jgi:hypothetical protein